MKTFRKVFYLIIIFAAVSQWSCKKYLEKTPTADISEADVFSTFNKFQGYVETMYDDVVDPIHLQNSFGEYNNGDDIIPTRFRGWMEGDYWYVMTSGKSMFYNANATRGTGTWSDEPATRNEAIWQNSWFGIRAANTTLAHLNDLVGTDEERQLIAGQAYFFRGYFHWELMRAWGNIPFVDTLYAADADMKIPQMGLYITAEKIIKDFQKAADLLPADWDQTTVGQQTLNKNIARATKGMALANMAECLLWCGSPLFNGVETGNYTYNVDYCKRAGDAAWQVIQLANQGVYALEPWATFKNNFMRKDGRFPMTKEIIMSPPQRGDGRWFNSCFTFGHIGIDPQYSAPTENYVELFEMANGYPIDDPASGFDPMNPWVNRDPRFHFNILVDRDRQITKLNTSLAFVQLYVGGRERNSICSLTGYGWKKYWDETINRYDNGWNTYYFSTPKLRLAEIYLFYAEAVNEAYGPTGSVPGSGLTAAAAVNIVRTRAGQPNVPDKFLSSIEAFRNRVWCERAVEIAYEGERWYDLRRWHVATQPQYKELYELQFDKDHTYFKKVLARTIQFSEQHYWLPFPVNQVSLYPGWKQNPGW